jgi:quinoprotein relay system zinc metallohydrolase 2
VFHRRLIRPPGAGRRRRLGAALWLALGAAGAAWGAPGEFALENPAPGVYVHYGRLEAMSGANGGDVANLGFVVGERCVAVIDTGGTQAVGLALRAAIARETSRPVCYVVNTHAHPDHVFGNGAFVEERPQFVGHARLGEAMARRGPNYLNALRRDLGAAAEASVLVAPTVAVADVLRLDLGGRALVVSAWRTAHTDHDVTVFDEASGTLFLGDLVFEGHLPVVDGNLRGFLAVLQELRRLPARLAVPGHGRAAQWPAVLDPQSRYLQALRDGVRQAIAERRTLAQAVDSVGQDQRGAWLLFDQFHRRNVTAAYAELEWED